MLEIINRMELDLAELKAKCQIENAKQPTVYWHNADKEKPTGNNQKYLVVIESYTLAGYYVSIARYTNDLHSFNDLDFPDVDIGDGWFSHSGEEGYYQINDVLYWAELPSVPKELSGV